MKKTKKITKPSTNPEKETNSRPQSSKESPWIEDYLDCFTLRMKPINEAFIHKLAHELMNWAQHDDDAIKFAQFYSKKRIPKTTFNRWTKEHEPLKEAKDIAREYISCRRELKALKREFDGAQNNIMMPYYDEDWKAMLKLREDIKKDVGTQDAAKVVLFPTYPMNNKECTCNKSE